MPLILRPPGWYKLQMVESLYRVVVATSAWMV